MQPRKSRQSAFDPQQMVALTQDFATLDRGDQVRYVTIEDGIAICSHAGMMVQIPIHSLRALSAAESYILSVTEAAL